MRNLLRGAIFIFYINTISAKLHTPRPFTPIRLQKRIHCIPGTLNTILSANAAERFRHTIFYLLEMERPALDTVGTIVDGIKSVTDNLGPIISTAFSLISKIVEIAQTVKANRKKCATMAERVSGLKAPLQSAFA